MVIKILKMIENIDPLKSLVVSIASVVFGTFLSACNAPAVNVTQTDTILRWIAWIVAIIAGLCTTANYIHNWVKEYKQKQKRDETD